MDNPVDLLLELLTHDGWGYQPKSTISDFSPWVYINVIMGCQSTPKRRRCLRYMETEKHTLGTGAGSVALQGRDTINVAIQSLARPSG